MITTRVKWVSLFICITYILIQSFQWWVFSHAPQEENPVAEFLFDATPLSVIRSWLMLLAMFGLMYVHAVISMTFSATARIASFVAIGSFFTFFLLEVALRAVELFHIQIQLPIEYVSATEQAKDGIIAYVTRLRQIQMALYFPLGMSLMIGSFMIGAFVPSDRKLNWLVKAAFYFNALRILLRSATTYFGLNLFPGTLYNSLYLPMVVVVFGLSALYFLTLQERPERLQSTTSY